MSKTESKITKTQQIEELSALVAELTEELREANLELSRQRYKIVNITQDLLNSEAVIKSLRIENDTLSHTPEIAADTQSAFDRGRQDGVRSLTNKATRDLLSFANELNALMNELANKYTRDLTLDVFLGTVEPVEEVKKLPVTDFTAKLLTNITSTNWIIDPPTSDN